MVIFRLQKTVVDRAFQKRPVVIVVPVENEDVDTVVSRRVDLLRHYLRIVGVKLAEVVARDSNVRVARVRPRLSDHR